MLKVLIVDDQPAVRAALELMFELHGIPTLSADSPEGVLDLIAAEDVGVVLQDMNFRQEHTSGAEGVALFHAIHELDPELPVVLMTAWTALETAVQLIKEGAADYIAKPWDDDKLLRTVKNLLRMRELAQDNVRMRAQASRARRALADRADLRGLVYASQAMHDVVTLAVSVAASDAPILITGPNGSGKEKLAEIVQANSRRKRGPFVKVNAGGLPAELLEAELFGAEPGAFTGATKLRIGRFETADGGTLFLDELGNLPLAGQAKLLRVLQTGEYERLGSSATRRADVRIISATNADLPRLIAAGTFREDLYYRLNVIELFVPALADRAEDILPLAEHFLAALQQDGPARAFADDARAALVAHEWPGNVRELQNRVQRATLVATGDAITAQDLGLTASAPRPRT
ncbi:MAG: sigma-54 dependent transcriptional regulator, partial [Deltaproteobacteria bacterium]|nr:sigma-54 dependent transcriptional regulator [Kofleriaceae bacterium]